MVHWLSLYLLVLHFMDRCIREAVVMKEAHLLVEQAVDNMSSRILPFHKADKLTIQGGTQIHRPVIAVQCDLKIFLKCQM